MEMIIVDARFDRMGNLEIAPRNRRIQRKYEKHMDQFGCATHEVFVLEGIGLEDMSEIPDRHLRRLLKGLNTSFKIDPWIFGTWLGYDAQHAV